MTEEELVHPLAGLNGKNGRPRNRRRVTLDHLKKIKGWANAIADSWDVGARVSMDRDEYAEAQARVRASGGFMTYASGLRARRPEEYPENQPEAWRLLGVYMRAIANEADEIRMWAEEQANLTARRLEEKQD